MITRILLSIFILFIVLFLPVKALTNGKGAPASNTGAPFNDTCAADGCHDNAMANTGAGSISVTTPDAFRPGETISFTIKVEQAGASRFGFQATIRPVNDTLRFTGEFILGLNTDFSDAIGRYITHDDALEADGSAEWTFQWKAPDEDIGNIIIYVAGVAGNGNGKNTGDDVYVVETTMPIQVSLEEEPLPASFTLQQAYPNPFRNRTTISYSMQQPEPVRVALYDALGRIVKSIDEGMRPAGTYELLIDANDLPAGTYFYEVQTPTTRKARSLTRLP